MGDPRERKVKRFYIKHVFFGNEELYKEFLKHYDEAVADGSTSAEDMAMIRFRDKYEETDEGWIKKEEGLE